MTVMKYKDIIRIRFLEADRSSSWKRKQREFNIYIDWNLFQLLLFLKFVFLFWYPVVFSRARKYEIERNCILVCCDFVILLIKTIYKKKNQNPWGLNKHWKISLLKFHLIYTFNVMIWYQQAMNQYPNNQDRIGRNRFEKVTIAWYEIKSVRFVTVKFPSVVSSLPSIWVS